jgi:hypothetical protein
MLVRAPEGVRSRLQCAAMAQGERMRIAVIPSRDTSTLRIAQIQNLGEQARTALKPRLPCGQRVADDASQSAVECQSPASCAGCGESGMVREAPRPRETPPHNKAGTGEYHGCISHDAHTWRGIGAQYWAKGPAGVHVRRSHVKRAQLTPRSASVRRTSPATLRLRPPAAPVSSAARWSSLPAPLPSPFEQNLGWSVSARCES